MLEDDNNESDHSLSLPEIDLLEQLNKMNLNEKDESEHDASNEAAITKASSKLLLRTNPVFRDDRASSKFRAALGIIKDKIMTSDDKAVVVSQWTSVLNLFRVQLVEAGIQHCAINGQVPVKSRNGIVCDFNSKSSKTKVCVCVMLHC